MVCALLMMTVASSGFCCWMIIFGTSSMPGPKFVNGVIFGLAEFVACLTTGYIVRFIKDSTAIIICCVIGLVSASAFYLTGGIETGMLGAILLFMEVYAVGAVYSLCFVLTELRVPPESYGSTTVLSGTLALIFSGFSHFFAHAEGIVPTVTVVFLFI